jgi:hypothetical protein
MYPLPEIALAQHTAILGKTGSGKTTTGKLIVEQVFGAGYRVCVLDPIKSDWWGVISSADGKSPGLPFHILGGPRGHVPLHSGAGHAIGEIVATGELPFSVLDMAEFEPGGQARFFVDFAQTLMKRMQGVLYLVMEEAHEFAPKERSGIGQESMSIHYAKKLATAGRSKGIRLIVATQRTQSLHNAMLGSCETMIVHRLTAPADQDPVKKWLKANTEKAIKDQVEASLSSLKTGTAWVCSGEAQIFGLTKFPRISTFDNSAAPKQDSKPVDVARADVDLSALRELIGEAVEEAEANDAKVLKARIADLERQIKVLPATSKVVADNSLVEMQHQIEILQRDNAALEQHRDKLAAGLTALQRKVVAARDQLSGALLDAPVYVPPQPVTRKTVGTVPSGVITHAPPPKPRTKSVDAKLSKAQHGILRAFWWLKDEDATPAKVSFYSGYRRSGHFDTSISSLRTAGLVKGWRITADGESIMAPITEPKPDGPELREWLRPKIGAAPNAILDALINAKGKRLSVDELSEAAGYSKSGHFDTCLSTLRTLGAAEGYAKDGGVKAADIFIS